MDCCKEELPFILPSEVIPAQPQQPPPPQQQQQQQQQQQASEPQSSGDGDTTVGGEGEQMSPPDQTVDNVTEATAEQTDTRVVSVDPTVSPNVQEDVVEPMELDHHTNAPAITIIPTGTRSLYFLHVY